MSVPTGISTVPVPVAARLLGMSESGVYKAIREGKFPTQTFKVGDRTIIPRKPLLDMLGLDELPKMEAAA
ncbi:helix-turn-helix domain-containing protein [Corynebacterium mastitidis]|uniref:helix-turn-helix domain-containing protein n=1 Tax=Corynebacterium mastitidis TaxID=161890 RepID=UPI0012FF30F4|nr:helix-turn-helix domain-containing protein [Corynebacterium mastitidis]